MTAPNFPTASFHEIARLLKKMAPYPPFVLQIGAMDGKRFDLMHEHFIVGGWRGLLVEPVPDMFQKLQQTYADHPELTLVNTAIADHDGMLKLYRVDPALVESRFIHDDALGITSAYRDRGVFAEPAFQQAFPEAAEHLLEIQVPCVTLPRLLETHSVQSIQLCMVDTEGADWMILRQLDMARYRPSLICMEYYNLKGDDMRDCCQHFMAHNYKMALCGEDHQNLLFYLGA